MGESDTRDVSLSSSEPPHSVFAVSLVQMRRFLKSLAGKPKTALDLARDRLIPRCVCSEDCVDCVCGGRHVLKVCQPAFFPLFRAFAVLFFFFFPLLFRSFSWHSFFTLRSSLSSPLLFYSHSFPHLISTFARTPSPCLPPIPAHLTHFPTTSTSLSPLTTGHRERDTAHPEEQRSPL